MLDTVEANESGKLTKLLRIEVDDDEEDSWASVRD